MAVEAIIAGLGNPGKKYERNRHNAGFLFLDEMASRFGVYSYTKKFGAETGKGSLRRPDGTSIEVLFIKPMGFMNLSGESVGPALKFHKLGVDRLLVVHDEIELAFGDVRIKKGGGHKGHNGLRDIISHAGSPEFTRIRMGVGRPTRGEVADYVLSDFSKDEQSRFDVYFDDGRRLMEEWLEKLP